MKKIALWGWMLVLMLLVGNKPADAQSKAGDIPAAQLPSEVQQVLEEYVNILRTSSDLDACAERFRAIAGGTLVNEDGNTLRSTVAQFGLKKDFQNIKFYANPIRITRANKSAASAGYGASAIRGTVYKIWIDKANPKNGMPAPVQILLPDGSNPNVKTPKVINVGSY